MFYKFLLGKSKSIFISIIDSKEVVSEKSQKPINVRAKAIAKEIHTYEATLQALEKISVRQYLGQKGASPTAAKMQTSFVTYTYYIDKAILQGRLRETINELKKEQKQIKH